MPNDEEPLFGEVIYAYTDAQALEDGVLVAISGEGGVNRVTRAVFDHFAKAIGESAETGPVTDITPLMEAIRTILKNPADNDGWRTATHDHKELWLIPNETGGLTLMFPRRLLAASHSLAITDPTIPLRHKEDHCPDVCTGATCARFTDAMQ